MRIDCHNHANYSPDAHQTLEELVLTAIGKGVRYLAVTEHMDLGFPNDVRPAGEPIFDYRVNRTYFDEIEALRDKYGRRIEIVAGVEAGYTRNEVKKIRRELIKYPFGYIVNSVHICHGLDCYWQGYFDGYDKESAYNEYLDTVLYSLDAPYRYDAVGHLGYISRPAPFDRKRLIYSDFAKKLDEILYGIIEREKILEINSSVGALEEEGAICLPDLTILERYYELGGRTINFGSDSHRPEKFNYNYDVIIAELKRIGFTEWTVVRRGRYEKEEID